MITSKDNQYIKLVRDLSKKKHRDAYGLFLAEGKRLINDLIDAGFLPYLLLYMEDFSDIAFLERVCPRADQVFPVSKPVFHKLCETKNDQGIIAAFPQLCPNFERLDMRESGLLIILNKIADPGNLGAIIRNCAAADVDAVLLEEGSVDLYNPKTVRATMGTIAKIPVFHGLSREEISRFLEQQKVKAYLADMNESISFNELPTDRKLAVILGNEGNGVSEEWRFMGLSHVSIPMENGVESLNVAMAAGIIAYDHYIRCRKT